MHSRAPYKIPEPREGLPFELHDLRAALAWSGRTPGVRLNIRLDCVCIAEAIEICPPGSTSPRWFIWRTHEGRLRVDDWGNGAFGLPYTTVEGALGFVSREL